MNISEILQNGNLLVIRALDGLPEKEWDVPGACGDWSVKDIVAHLASNEHIIIDVLNTFQESETTPAIEQWVNSRAVFNKEEVEARKYATAQQVMDEFQDAQVEAASLIMQIPSEKVQQTGTIPWYGKEHSLADFISQAYEHMREHCAQITLFHSRVKAEMEGDSSVT
jgi:uncharacterized damage-inducible protein DinB